jgi:hypothetical protein
VQSLIQIVLEIWWYNTVCQVQVYFLIQDLSFHLAEEQDTELHSSERWQNQNWWQELTVDFVKVQKPMLPMMDCKGAIDLEHSWSTGNRTCHMAIQYHYLQEVNYEGIIQTLLIDGDEQGIKLGHQESCRKIDSFQRGMDDPSHLVTKNTLGLQLFLSQKRRYEGRPEDRVLGHSG